MKTPLLIFLLVFLLRPALIEANPISPPYLPVRDYIRGTYGEPLYVANARLVGRHALRITNELRVCDYDTYWDAEGQKRDLNDYAYTRFVNFLHMDYGISENIEFGARWYYLANDLEGIESNLTSSNEGFGDLLLRVRVNPFDGWTRGLSLGTSVKFPTGAYEPPTWPPTWIESLPTGTGSMDISLMAYGSYNLKFLDLHADLGYVITGETEYSRFNGKKWEVQDLNLGDVFSYDLSLVRLITPFISGIVEFNGYTMGSSKDDEGRKIEDPSHRLSIAPGVAISISKMNLIVEGGFSHDLVGKNTLRGASPLLRVKFTGQIPI